MKNYLLLYKYKNMPTDNKNNRRTQSHIFFLAVLIAVFAVATIVSSCRNDGELSSSEQKEMLYYNNAINNAQDSGLYEKMRKLCKEFYEVSKKGHSDLFRAHAVSYYGQESLLFGNPEEGKKLLDEALQIASKTSDDTLMMEIYNGLGLYHQVKDGNYYAASEYYLKSLEYARRCDKQDLLAVLCNLGASYGCANDTTGLKYIREAYEIAKETGNPNDMMYASMRMADQMKMRGNKEETLKWQQIWMENLPEARRMVFENVIKAENSFLQNNFTEALRYIDIAIVAADTTKNLQTVEKTNIIIEKAKILYELGRYEESIKWLDKDTVMASMANNKIRRESRLLYAMNYEKLGNHVKALENQKKYIEYIEEETKVDRINILKAKEVALDVTQKDEEIAQHMEHARMLRQKVYGLLAFCLLLVGASLYIYNMYRKQRKLMTVVVERAQPETVTIEQKQMDDKHVELFHRIKHEIDDNKMFLDANLSREFLSEHLNINRTYISEAISQMAGMSFPQYISSLRVAEAERRLHDLSVDVSNLTDFGRTLGFTSLSAFQAAFKRQTGMTLSAYREIARRGPTPALPV